jgi:hypothetical protein
MPAYRGKGWLPTLAIVAGVPDDVNPSQELYSKRQSGKRW